MILKNDLEQLLTASKVNIKAVQVVYNCLQHKAEEQVLPFARRSELGVSAGSAGQGVLGRELSTGSSFS